MATPGQTIEMTPRGRTIAGLAALALLGSWLSGDASVRLAAAMLSAPLLVDFARKPRSLGSVKVHVGPRRTVVGQAFRESLRIENHGSAPLREVILLERRTRSAPALLAHAAPGASVATLLSCHSPERGHLLERVFELATEWPLGLFRSRATAVVRAELVAEPRRVPTKVLPQPNVDDHRHDSRPHPRHAGDEFHALREHHDDEDARGVHARRSAALGQLVRTVNRGRSPTVVGLVLDLRRPPGRSLGQGRLRLEWSLGVAATLVDTFADANCRVRIWVLGTRTVRTTVIDSKSHRDWSTFLAEATTGPHRALEPDALDGIDDLADCYWLPAGGYRAPLDRALRHGRLQVIDGGQA